MSGYIIPAVAERRLDFSGLLLGQTEEVVLADRMDVVPWLSLMMQVRVFDHSLAATSNTIDIISYPQSISKEDPGVVFVTSVAVPSINFITLSSTTPKPAYLTLEVPVLSIYNVVGPMMRIGAKATKNTAATFFANLSVEICAGDGT